MRTLALLAALLLLALRGQAEPLAEPADRGTEAEDPLPAQAQDGAEDQAMTISFEGDERPARDTTGRTCRCRRHACLDGETLTSKCVRGGLRFLRCCQG